MMSLHGQERDNLSNGAQSNITGALYTTEPNISDWMVTVGLVIALESLCRCFDIWVLWRWPRAQLYRFIVARRIVLVVKWMIHLVTGKCELGRLLRAEMPTGEKMSLIADVLRHSQMLKRQWTLILRSERLESVARQIAVKKRLPTKGTLFKMLLSAIQQIRNGRVLFDTIEKLCHTPYDHDNADHRKLLVRLWTAWKTEPFPEIPSEKWKELGFQGTDPATDFRAMGLFALHCLVVFAESKDSETIYNEAQYGPYWYSFAVVAVNVADAIHRYLRDDKLHCSEMSMVDAQFIKLMSKFHLVWMQSKPENLFAFNTVFSHTLAIYERLLI